MLKTPRVAFLQLFACVAAVLLMQACSGLKIAADVGYGEFGVTGDLGLGATGGGPPVNNIDVEDSLGLQGGQGSPYVRVEGAAAIIAFTASGFSFSEQAQGILRDAFGDIPANTAVDTKTDLTVLKGAVHFDLINLGPVRISPGVAVDYLDMSFVPTATGVSQEVTGQTPIPLVFLQAEATLGSISAVVDVGGIEADLKNARGSVYDIEGIVRFHPSENIHLFGGLRYLIMDADGDQDNQLFVADLKVTGWMAGLGIRF